MKRIALTLGTLLLAGCVGPNPYVTPVEDRSGQRGPTPPPGSVQPAEPAPGVSVQPVDEVPVFRPQRADTDTTGSAVTPAPVEPQSAPRNAAVVALLDGAQQDTAGGDLRAAQNRLERALRIAPRDPQVYYQLADVQRRMGQFLQAEQVALKGINVASGQPQQLRRLWSLVALIRSDAGDSAGARAAQQEASRY
jgi:hypothetical protein